ncbi:hypothetical protein GPL15_20300 [Clostridium sp. MCC353]|uniref:hypothetical protein n=1 Tax=Clostridium sp. MCC353 TaxID=2592646 RepID=UPI001C016392|nr:hypothetical protein [Clostridium sp. MCC353]MBT9778824.1 hypothetical protein [Clostridium sp. MCC353]
MIVELSKPFILIDETGLVQNIALFLNYEEANVVARTVYGNNALALEYRYLVQEGDIYRNGTLYNKLEDGTELPAQYIPTQDEQINLLQNKNLILEDQLTSTQTALAEQYEANQILEQEVTNTQLALTELYEKMEA